MSYFCEDKEAAQRIAKSINEFRKSIFSNFGIEFKSYPFTIKLWLLDGRGEEMAGFTLIEQVNCCGLLVSTRTFVNKGHRGEGLAQEMMLVKEALAKEFGYSAMIATVNISGNPAEKHILEKFGWACNSEFVNSRTKNTVGIFTKVL